MPLPETKLTKNQKVIEKDQTLSFSCFNNEATLDFDLKNDKGYTFKTYWIDENTFEFEIILNKKPKSNIINIPIKSKEQLFFTENLKDETKDNIFLSDDRMLGGVECYTYNKDNIYIIHKDHIEKKEYKTGKLFNIYCPVAFSHNNKLSVKCKLLITKNNLKIVVPQSFLDNADYPIIVDPTFGYTTAGTKTTALSGPFSNPNRKCAANDWSVSGSFDHTAGSGETAIQFACYVKTQAIFGIVRPELQLYSYDPLGLPFWGLPITRLAPARITTLNATTTAQWLTTGVLSDNMVTGTTYTLGIGEQGSTKNLIIHGGNFASIGFQGTSLLPTNWVDTGNHNSIFALSAFTTYTITASSTIPVSMGGHRHFI